MDHFQIGSMPSTLELLRAEIEAQHAEEARAPFNNVDTIRAYIAQEKPATTDNITLEMCWLGVKEYDKFWRAELINLADERDFETVSAMYKALDPARRCKYTFVLKIWKNYNQTLNNISYREGFSYRFEKVHSLQLNYGNPVGSMQIRDRLQAVPLPPPGFPDFTRASGLESSSTASETDSASEPRTRSNTRVQDPIATVNNTPPRGVDHGTGTATAAKTPLKRKTRQNDAKEVASESLTKKARTSVAKELFLASPKQD